MVDVVRSTLTVERDSGLHVCNIRNSIIELFLHLFPQEMQPQGTNTPLQDMLGLEVIMVTRRSSAYHSHPLAVTVITYSPRGRVDGGHQPSCLRISCLASSLAESL